MNKIIEKIKDDRIINLIREFIKTNNVEADVYLVGGVVRDFYLGKENFDKDIIVNNIDAQTFSQKLAKFLDATFIELDAENEIYRLVLKDKINFIDVAALIGECIEDDLKRRDLTINSVAVNLKNFELIDINNGIKDLKNKKIRQICVQNFLDDPLRLLRIYRFQSLLGFSVDKDLIEIVKKYSKNIHNSAVERINYEFLKLFSGDYAAKSLLDMDESGLLKEVLPIMEDVKKVPSNSHHHLSLFFHSVEVVKQVQKIYESSSIEVKSHLDKVEFGGFTKFTYLKFASFLHDIGKPDTWTIEEVTGRHRFIKHDDIGSKLAIKILKNAKFSKKQIDYISKMIKYHIYPSHVVGSPEINDKIYMRFIRKMNEDVIDIIFLAMADRLSARGVEITEDIVTENISNLQKLLDFYLAIKDTLKPLPKLLSGDEIMKMLEIGPSKELGHIIDQLKEAQLSGNVITKDDAIKFVESIS